MKCDVLVVGGGPVGLVMASELARYGLSVRIVDKAPRRTDKSKALVVWSRTLELMDRMGCTSSFLDTGRKAFAANISSGKEQIARLTLEGVASPYPFALMIPQNETERLLEQQLNSCGVKLERNIEGHPIYLGSRCKRSSLDASPRRWPRRNSHQFVAHWM